MVLAIAPVFPCVFSLLHVSQHHGHGFPSILPGFLMAEHLILIPVQYKEPGFSSTHCQIVASA